MIKVTFNRPTTFEQDGVVQTGMFVEADKMEFANGLFRVSHKCKTVLHGPTEWLESVVEVNYKVAPVAYTLNAAEAAAAIEAQEPLFSTEPPAMPSTVVLSSVIAAKYKDVKDEFISKDRA